MAVEKQNEKRLFYYQHLNVFLVQTISILNEASILHIVEYCSCLTRCHVCLGKAVFLLFLLGRLGEANQIVLLLSLIPHHLRSPSIHILELVLVSLYNICLFLNIIHEGEHLLQVNQENHTVDSKRKLIDCDKSLSNMCAIWPLPGLCKNRRTLIQLEEKLQYKFINYLCVVRQ